MAGRAEIVVGTARARPGQFSTGTLSLGRYPDGPITTPVNIACGAQPGPVLWAQAAIHGTETGGALGLLKLMRGIDRARMSGTIVAIMAANPEAFRGYSRTTPLDGENLNRLFPGNPSAGHSRQIAALLMRTAESVADAAIDLHSGGNEAVVPFYALYWDDGSDASARSRELALATGARSIWKSSDAWLGGAMFANLTRRGKPALIIENGGGGMVSEKDIDTFANAVAGVARAMGILPGSPPRRRSVREMTRCTLVFNGRGGYFVPRAAVGDVVPKHAQIATIMDPHGRVVETIRSPIGPAYIAALARPYLPVHSGAMVAECIKVAER